MLVAFVGDVFAQQTPQYSQYTFNNFGYNPAFAGSTKCSDFRAGGRMQWVGMDGAPRSYFASFHKSLGGEYFKNSGKHAIGAYIEQDDIHITTRTYIKLAYAYHKRLFAKMTGAVGIFGGIQQYAVDDVFQGGYANDPVLSAASGSVLRYPDFTPGVLLYNNKQYFSLSVHQLYFKNIKLGDKMKQRNQYYFGWGHTSSVGNWGIFKSILLKMGRLGPPAFDANLAWTYRQNLTFGLGYRAGESAIANVKFKLLSNMYVGYAFDFPVNKLMHNYGHEIMIGFSKCSGAGVGSGQGQKPHTCPAYL